MHRSQHGESEPSETIQDSSDFSEVIQEWTVYCQDKKKLIGRAKHYFVGLFPAESIFEDSRLFGC